MIAAEGEVITVRCAVYTLQQSMHDYFKANSSAKEVVSKVGNLAQKIRTHNIRELFQHNNLPHRSLLNKKKKIIEQKYIDLTCDNSLKSKFNLENPTKFRISLKNKYPALTKKALRMIVLFAMSYSCEIKFSPMAVIKIIYRSRINVERETPVAISKILPKFDKLCRKKQAHSSY